MFLKAIWQLSRSIQTSNTISPLLCCPRFLKLKCGGHSNPKPHAESEHSLLWIFLGELWKLCTLSNFPQLLACYQQAAMVIRQLLQKITMQMFSALIVLHLYTFYLIFCVGKSSSSTTFSLWMGTFSTHRFTHFTFHFRGKIFSFQIVKDLRSLATANENYLCQLKLRETLRATRMRKGDTGRPHGVGRKIQELRLLFLFFPVVLTFF